MFAGRGGSNVPSHYSNFYLPMRGLGATSSQICKEAQSRALDTLGLNDNDTKSQVTCSISDPGQASPISGVVKVWMKLYYCLE